MSGTQVPLQAFYYVIFKIAYKLVTILTPFYRQEHWGLSCVWSHPLARAWRLWSPCCQLCLVTTQASSVCSRLYSPTLPLLGKVQHGCSIELLLREHVAALLLQTKRLCHPFQSKWGLLSSENIWQWHTLLLLALHWLKVTWPQLSSEGWLIIILLCDWKTRRHYFLTTLMPNAACLTKVYLLPDMTLPFVL